MYQGNFFHDYGSNMVCPKSGHRDRGGDKKIFILKSWRWYDDGDEASGVGCSSGWQQGQPSRVASLRGQHKHIQKTFVFIAHLHVTSLISGRPLSSFWTQQADGWEGLQCQQTQVWSNLTLCFFLFFWCVMSFRRSIKDLNMDGCFSYIN